MIVRRGSISRRYVRYGRRCRSGKYRARSDARRAVDRVDDARRHFSRAVRSVLCVSVCALHITYVCIFLFFLRPRLDALGVTVETFCTRVPVLRRAIDLIAADCRRPPPRDEATRAQQVFLNAFEKQPGLHPENISLYSVRHRVTDRLKGFARAHYLSNVVGARVKGSKISEPSLIARRAVFTCVAARSERTITARRKINSKFVSATAVAPNIPG